MDFDSLSCPFPPAAPVSSHSNISEVPKKSQNRRGWRETPPAVALKLCGKHPVGSVSISPGVQHPKNPQAGRNQRQALFLQLCPKPRALDGEQELELPFPAGSRCPLPAGTFPLASCSSGGSRVACLCCLTPHQLHFQHLKGRGKSTVSGCSQS